MTYFGVNYFLTGLHSYAAGEAAHVPPWVHIGILFMAVVISSSWIVNRMRSWSPAG
jgi:hypothetical protein